MIALNRRIVLCTLLTLIIVWVFILSASSIHSVEPTGWVTAKTKLSHYRIGLSFIIPVRSNLSIARRGNTYVAEVRAENGEYFVSTSSWPVIRPEEVNNIVLSGPCPIKAEQIIQGSSFQTECETAIGLNPLKRRIYYLWIDGYLHILYMTYRIENQSIADTITASIAPSPEYAGPVTSE